MYKEIVYEIENNSAISGSAGDHFDQFQPTVFATHSAPATASPLAT